MARKIERSSRGVNPTATPQVDKINVALDDNAKVAQYGAGQMESVADIFFRAAAKQQEINDATEFNKMKADYMNASNDLIAQIQQSSDYQRYVETFDEGVGGILDRFNGQATNQRVAKEFNEWAVLHNANKRVAVQGVQIQKMEEVARAQTFNTIDALKKQGLDPTQFAQQMAMAMDAAGVNFDPDQRAAFENKERNDYAMGWETARMNGAVARRGVWTMNERSKPYLESTQVDALNNQWAAKREGIQKDIWSDTYNDLYTDITAKKKSYSRETLAKMTEKDKETGYSKLSGQHMQSLLNIQENEMKARRIEGAYYSLDRMVKENRQAEMDGKTPPHDIMSFKSVLVGAGMHEWQADGIAMSALRAGVSNPQELELLAMDPVQRELNGKALSGLLGGIGTGETDIDKIRYWQSGGVITGWQAIKVSDALQSYKSQYAAASAQRKADIRHYGGVVGNVLTQLKGSLNLTEQEINGIKYRFNSAAVGLPDKPVEEITEMVVQEIISKSIKSGPKRDKILGEASKLLMYQNPGAMFDFTKFTSPATRSDKIDFSGPLGVGVGSDQAGGF